VPCPRCGDLEQRGPVIWTAWGGFLGALVLLLAGMVRCQVCGATFNKLTGRASHVHVIYVAIPLVVFAIVIVLLLMMG
jgi:uncharacterized membrane protein YidH (DUF202 family)